MQTIDLALPPNIENTVEINSSKQVLKLWLEYINKPTSKNQSSKLDVVKKCYKKLVIKKNKSCKIITIVGTNGKGSCAKLMESIAIESGLKAGCFTSPHLFNYNERIRINGKNISDEKIIYALNKIELCRENESLSFFNYTTLAAWIIFNELSDEEKLDWIILEAGIGGRLDSVNIFDADYSIITSIGLDHTEMLGESCEEIAKEKCGVFRPQQTAFLATEVTPSIDDIISHCARENSTKLIKVNTDFSYEVEDKTIKVSAKDSYLLQAANNTPINLIAACTALSEVILQADAIDNKTLNKALTSSTQPARCQHIKHSGCDFIIDVAHNAEAAAHLAQAIQSLNKNENKTVAAHLGLLKDKSNTALISALKDYVDQWLFVCNENPRAAGLEQLQAIAIETNIKAKFINEQEWLRQLKNSAYKNQLLVICGSFHIAAIALQQITK